MWQPSRLHNVLTSQVSEAHGFKNHSGPMRRPASFGRARHRPSHHRPSRPWRLAPALAAKVHLEARRGIQS